MLNNYLKSAFRNFRNRKFYTVLNITGLSLGMAAGLLIFLYVKYERSFDSFHSHADDIYRIQYNGWQNGQLLFECAAAVPAAGPALKNNFREVKAFTRLFPVSGIVTYDNPELGRISFREEKMQITDTSLFKVFDFPLLAGDAATALRGPNKALISETAAKKYFGSTDPMGKTITWDGNNRFEITGVFKDIPENSHVKFTFLFSYETLNQNTGNSSETSWGWYDFNTYVLLEPHTDARQLQTKWNAFLEETRKEDWNKNNSRQEFILQPLLDIHLHSRLLQESQPEDQRDGDSVKALSVIAIFILIIAWVNYINLATARSFDRANEVGVRKVMGAAKGQLVSQFLTESLLLNAVSAGCALLLVRLSWSWFSALSGWHISLSFVYSKEFWLLTVIMFLAGVVLSGFYPAIILSSFRPVAVLKGKIIRSVSGSILRKGLVIFQFAASVILISGSVIVYEQLRFMKNQNLGIDINETLVLKGPGIVDSLYDQKVESFKNEVLHIGGVKAVTAASSIPGDEIFWTRDIRRSSGSENKPVVYNAAIDYEYIPAFGIKVIAGRNFSKNFPDDNKRIVMNKALSDLLEFNDPQAAIGEKVYLDDDTLEIAGVVENYHQMSLKNEVAPLVLRLLPYYAYYSLKLETSNYKALLASLQGPWNTFFPDNPMDHFFLDQFFNRQYIREDRFGNVFSLFTLLAIFIACLGLFGLASFMTVQRTKEIGIRKALGSTTTGIVLLLSRGFIQLVLIANLIAWPAAWWIMEKWLQSFPYRITINPLLFVAAGISVVIVAFLSVSSQTIKAAMTQPAQTLKYE